MSADVVEVWLFRAAHPSSVARLLLARRLGVPPDEVRWTRGPHGKPEMPGIRFNLSRSGGLAALAACADRPVGVDVQRLPERLAAELSKRYFRPAEGRFVAAGRESDARAGRFAQLWARKEACVKAAGGRLAQGLRLPVHGPLTIGSGGAEYRIKNLTVPQGFRGAVALAGADRFTVDVRSVGGPMGTIAELAEILGEDARHITAATSIEDDLELDYTDLAALAAAVRERYGDRVDLAGYLAGLDIDRLIGLTVGELAAYIESRIGAV